jgi:hypothetical protein
LKRLGETPIETRVSRPELVSTPSDVHKADAPRAPVSSPDHFEGTPPPLLEVKGWVNARDKPFLTLDAKGTLISSDTKTQSSSVALNALHDHLAQNPNLAHADLVTLQQAAQRVYDTRGTLGWIRDGVSWLTFGLIGKSEPTKAYEALQKRVQNLPRQRSASEIASFEKLFGSGVKFSDATKQTWSKLFQVLPHDEAIKLLDVVHEAMRDPTKKDGLGMPAMVKLIHEISPLLPDLVKDKKISEHDLLTFRQLFNTAIEQLNPEVFNSQYVAEYLPKYFMGDEDQQSDLVLKREGPALAQFKAYMDKLPANDPRKLTYEKQIREARNLGFNLGTDLEVQFGGGGVLPDSAVMRTYGLRRTGDGFLMLNGLQQGDRRALGLDLLPWPPGSKEQDLSFMLMLRAVMKATTPEDRSRYFETAFALHGKDLHLSESKKAELKKALVDFAGQQQQRIDGLLAQVLPKRNV